MCIGRSSPLDGVFIDNLGDCKVIEIRHLSDEMKDKIKNELQIICYGEYALSSCSKYYSLNETIREFNIRIPDDENKKTGIIGELLLNVVIRTIGDKNIVSPLFNLEQRDFKKGFDIIAMSGSELWFIESKAGHVSGSQDATQKISERVGEAKRCLERRLNEDSSQLWTNATNSVSRYLDYRDEKQTVVNIVEGASNSGTSLDKNVVLGGTAFCPFSSEINRQKILDIHNTIKNSGIFSKLQIIAIQKQTMEAVIDFLKDLENSDE
jgi:hypothetical protein